MKDCTQALAEKLNSESEFICCDLYKLRLQNGTTYYIADFDKDVAFNGITYRSDMFLMNREQTKLSGTPSVDTLSVTINADKNHNDNVDGKYIMKAVHDGALDDAYLMLIRCYMDAETGSVLGIINMFQGRCEVNGVGGISCKVNVKSDTLGLNAQFPTRTFAPQNVYQEKNGQVVTASTDSYTCMIPLKPSRNVLMKL